MREEALRQRQGCIPRFATQREAGQFGSLGQQLRGQAGQAAHVQGQTGEPGQAREDPGLQIPQVLELDMQFGQGRGVEVQGAVQAGQLSVFRGHVHREVLQLRCLAGFESFLDRQVGQVGHGCQECLRQGSGRRHGQVGQAGGVGQHMG